MLVKFDEDLLNLMKKYFNINISNQTTQVHGIARCPYNDYIDVAYYCLYYSLKF